MQNSYPVTPDQLVQFKATALANGMIIPDGNSGQVSTHGVTLGFSYDGTAKLTLTILDKPWWMPASSVWSALEKYLP